MGKKGHKEVIEKFFAILGEPERYPQAKAIQDLIKTSPRVEEAGSPKKSADQGKER